MELVLLNGYKNKRILRKKQGMSKITTNLKSTSYEDNEKQDIMKEFYQIKRNLIINPIFINFLEGGNRYGAEIFRVY